MKGFNIMKEQIKKLREWVKENYNPRATGYTVEHSRGNEDDCFSDGAELKTSWLPLNSLPD